MIKMEKYNFKNGSVILYKNNNFGEVVIYRNKKVFMKKYYRDFESAKTVYNIVIEWLERSIKDNISLTLIEIKNELCEKEMEVNEK